MWGAPSCSFIPHQSTNLQVNTLILHLVTMAHIDTPNREMAALRGVARPQATQAMAWGVATNFFVDCSNCNTITHSL
jgi:hypothetical protein